MADPDVVPATKLIVMTAKARPRDLFAKAFMIFILSTVICKIADRW